MVIQNSEVSMASKSSYTATTKVNVQISREPAIKLGDITFKLPNSEENQSDENEVKEVRILICQSASQIAIHEIFASYFFA